MAFVAEPPTGWLGREKRLAAALLLSLLDASEPEQVERLREMARAIADDERLGVRDDVHDLLTLIDRGPFVVGSKGSALGNLDPAEDLAAVFAA